MLICILLTTFDFISMYMLKWWRFIAKSLIWSTHRMNRFWFCAIIMKNLTVNDCAIFGMHLGNSNHANDSYGHQFLTITFRFFLWIGSETRFSAFLWTKCLSFFNVFGLFYLFDVFSLVRIFDENLIHMAFVYLDFANIQSISLISHA